MPRLSSLGVAPIVLAAPGVAQHVTTVLVTEVPGTPVRVTAPAGDARLFIAEREGRVRVFEGGGLLPDPLLDVTGLIAAGAFTGLRSLVFHPEHAANGHFYVSYNAPSSSSRELVVARFTVTSGAPNVADPASRFEILRVPDENGNAGGDLHFGPDGMLYVATGDGHGNGGDPSCHAQNGLLLWGKVLRLDVDGGAPYAIPAGNPSPRLRAVVAERRDAARRAVALRSAARNDFTLSVAEAAHGQPGLFYYGTTRTSLPLGDGFRCVGGLTFRLNPPIPTGASDGGASRLVDFTAFPASAGA